MGAMPGKDAHGLSLFTAPMSASASPRNTVIGHAIGVVVGYCSLVLTGLAPD